MGGTRFELVTSSVSGRPAACRGESRNAPESTSPRRILPQGARGCLQGCREWLPLWLPLSRFGHPAAARSLPGFRRSVMIRRPSRSPRLDRPGPRIPRCQQRKEMTLSRASLQASHQDLAQRRAEARQYGITESDRMHGRSGAGSPPNERRFGAASRWPVRCGRAEQNGRFWRRVVGCCSWLHWVACGTLARS